ncbi:hypothetical protein Lser_V15G04727 [Lactuca serriola]
MIKLDKPDYSYLKRLFRELFTREVYQFDYIFDWTMLKYPHVGSSSRGRNHNLTSKYDFHSYMIRSMEEEFQRRVEVSGPLWGFVVAFMLFNIKLVGTKLQHVNAALALESVANTGGFFAERRLKPRDELFWFKKPELLLNLIHFNLFQVCGPILMKLYHPTTLCPSYPDGYELQGNINSTKYKRYNPWMGKGCKEKKKVVRLIWR